MDPQVHSGAHRPLIGGTDPSPQQVSSRLVFLLARVLRDSNPRMDARVMTLPITRVFHKQGTQ
jgi:hypothetical protein